MAIQRLSFIPLAQGGDDVSGALFKLDANDADLDGRLAALGNAAGKNVGTTAGTVAAGDDPRLAVPGKYIDGFEMIYAGPKAITLNAGAATIPSTGLLLRSAAPIALSGLIIAASTWYHVYVYSNAGVPAAEVVTTAPVPYSGTARQKTGDATRRYVGSVRSDSAGNLYAFTQYGTYVGYVQDTIVSGIGNVVSNGISTVRATVDLSAWLPVTAKTAALLLVNTSPSVALSIDNVSTGFSGSSAIFQVGPASRLMHPNVPMSSLTFTYFYTSSPANGAYINAAGYNFER